MIDLAKAASIAVDRAVTRYKHPDYDRTVKLRKDYTAFMTGEGLDEKMRRFARRESEADFKQRKDLTVHITKPITSAMIGPIRKLVNVKPVIDDIQYEPSNDAKSKELRSLLSTFYGGRDVDHYLSSLIDPAEMDPNAFVVLAFENFDFRYEKPSTYPFRVACDNVWDFQYFNGALQYLWLQFTIQYTIDEGPMDNMGKRKPIKKDGDRFVLYVDNFHIVFEQVKDTLSSKVEGVIMLEDGSPVVVTDTSVQFGKGDTPTYFLRTGKETLYTVTFYDQKSGQVPAYRLGCKPDGTTDGRTCVNMWDQAVPYLEKSVMQVSELDLTVRLHVFPRLIQYGPKCDNMSCNQGRGPNGDECETCHGTGMKTTHTTAQDHILVPWPGIGQDFKDLSNFLHYADLPTETIQQMRDIVKDTYDSAIRAMYGSDIYVKNTVADTATSKLIEQQSIYDTLQPKASWWSESRITTTKVTAAFNDMGENLVVVHRFPRRLGFESADQLIQMRKAAKEADADPATLVALDRDIRENVLVDDPVQAKKAATWAKFNPFPGKSEATITALISGGLCTERSALLWTEQALIFDRAEEQYETKEVGFYDLSLPKQREVITGIVDALLEERTDEKQANMEKFQLGMEPDPNADDTQDPNNDQNVDQPTDQAA